MSASKSAPVSALPTSQPTPPARTGTHATGVQTAEMQRSGVPLKRQASQIFQPSSPNGKKIKSLFAAEDKRELVLRSLRSLDTSLEGYQEQDVNLTRLLHDVHTRLPLVIGMMEQQQSTSSATPEQPPAVTYQRATGPAVSTPKVSIGTSLLSGLTVARRHLLEVYEQAAVHLWAPTAALYRALGDDKTLRDSFFARYASLLNAIAEKAATRAGDLVNLHACPSITAFKGSCLGFFVYLDRLFAEIQMSPSASPAEVVSTFLDTVQASLNDDTSLRLIFDSHYKAGLSSGVSLEPLALDALQFGSEKQRHLDNNLQLFKDVREIFPHLPQDDSRTSCTLMHVLHSVVVASFIPVSSSLSDLPPVTDGGIDGTEDDDFKRVYLQIKSKSEKKSLYTVLQEEGVTPLPGLQSAKKQTLLDLLVSACKSDKFKVEMDDTLSKRFELVKKKKKNKGCDAPAEPFKRSAKQQPRRSMRRATEDDAASDDVDEASLEE